MTLAALSASDWKTWVGRGEPEMAMRMSQTPARRSARVTSAVAPPWARASATSSAPPGMGASGPMTARCRMMPARSTRKRPCSSADAAWWWSRRTKLRFITSTQAPRSWGPGLPLVKDAEKLTTAARVASSTPSSPRPHTA